MTALQAWLEVLCTRKGCLATALTARAACPSPLCPLAFIQMWPLDGLVTTKLTPLLTDCSSQLLHI